MIKNNYLRLIIFLISACTISAKESNIDIIGRAEFGLNAHLTDFKEFPEYPICCTQFLGNTAFAYEVDLGVKFKFKKTLFGSPISYSAMLGYRNISVNLTESKQVGYKIYDNNYVPLMSDFTIENTIFLLNIKNRLTFENLFADNLSLDFGLDLGIPITNTFKEYEKAVSPNDYNFENGTRIRNEASGTIPKIMSLGISPAIGAKYLAYKNESLSILPLINLSYQVNPVVTGLQWNFLSAHIGAEFALNLGTKEVPPPPPPPMPIELPKAKEPEAPKPDTITINSLVYSDGKIVDKSNPITIVNSITKYNSSFELIPVLFYEKNNEVPQGIEQNNDKSLVNIGAYQILSAITDYAKANPNAQITARFITHNGEDETIVSKRYEWIKNYILQKDSHINLVLQKEHKKINSDDRLEILQDNQRLDFLINGKRKNINANWFLKEEITTKYPKVEFQTNLICTAPNCNSLLIIKSNDVIIDQSVGNSMQLKDVDLAAFKSGQIVDFTVEATDSKNNRKGNIYKAPFEIKNEIVQEKYVTTFNTNNEYNDYILGFCEFEKAEIYDVNESVLSVISKEIEAGKKVIIIPMTDNIGTEDFNSNLKKQRAKSALKYLKNNANLEIDYSADSSIGNENPYKRLLNRSVVIRVFNK